MYTYTEYHTCLHTQNTIHVYIHRIPYVYTYYTAYHTCIHTLNNKWGGMAIKRAILYIPDIELSYYC